MYAQNNYKQSRPKSPEPQFDDMAWAEQNIFLKRGDKGFGAEIFSSVAEEAANRCSRNSERNKPAQVRMFYDELVHWHGMVAAAGAHADDKLREVLPYIRMMRAKLAYAKGRKLIDEAFRDIFSTCISRIDDVESLKHCKLFFEAYLGFKKALEK